MDSLEGRRLLNFWEAVDQLEPVGLPGIERAIRVATAWIVSAHGGKAIDPKKIVFGADFDELCRQIEAMRADPDGYEDTERRRQCERDMAAFL